MKINESFDIKKVKELNYFTIALKGRVELMIALLDGRILINYSYKNDEYKEKYKFYVYNLKNNNNCDICFDTDKIYNMIQMSDGNIIIKTIDRLKVINIKEKEIQNIQTLNNINGYLLRKLINESILIDSKKRFVIYEYTKGRLIYIKNSDYKMKKIDKIKEILDICTINNNEIVIYCEEKGKLFGSNYNLIFYDIKQNNLINDLSIGNAGYDAKIKLMNKNSLIAFKGGCASDERKPELILIDIQKRKIKNKIVLDNYFSEGVFIPLNEKIFLIYCECPVNDISMKIFQYEIENEKNLIKKGDKDFKNDYIIKYYDNKIIIAKGARISLYG